MKKIILLMAVPFMMRAQSTIEAQPKSAEQVPAQLDKPVVEKLDMTPLEKIESIRQRVIKGEKMSDLAELYSEDPGSAKNGGRYSKVAKGVMVPEFEAVAFSLKPGDISEVFKTQYGYHFIQLIAKQGDVVDLRHILIMPK